MQECDVIVIGSGIGGLVSAALLSARGLKTVVIEQHYFPGGYLASFGREGFIFDAAVDCIAGVGSGGLISRTLELLGVRDEVQFCRVDPIRLSIFPAHHVHIDADVMAYVERLSILFPSESASIREFFVKSAETFKGLLKVTESVINGGFMMYDAASKIQNLTSTSYGRLLHEYFTDSRLKAILSDRCPFLGLPPSKVSAFAMLNLIMSYFVLGAYRPIGGFQRLADVLAGGIVKQGGRVVLRKRVERILLNHKSQCSAVRCSDGEEYATRYIVSNADYAQTFAQLIGGAFSKLAESMVHDPGVSSSFFIVYAGFKGGIQSHSSIGYFPSYDMDGFFAPGRAFSEDSTVGITIASVEDRSRAPDGHHTVVLHEMVEAIGQGLDKRLCAEKVINKAGKVIPGLEKGIVMFDAATSRTLERYTGNHRGAAFGWRWVPNFKGPHYHGIKNLFIAGHWGNMGSGVLSSAYSGAKAAGAILAREGILNVI